MFVLVGTVEVAVVMHLKGRGELSEVFRSQQAERLRRVLPDHARCRVVTGAIMPKRDRC